MCPSLTYNYKYPHPSITVDAVVFALQDGEWKILLIRRANNPYRDYWAFPGGFMNIDESAESAVIRELWEETNLRVSSFKQFHTFSSPQRDPRERVVSIAYYALIKCIPVVAGDDASSAKWFLLSDLPDLAFDHADIMRTVVNVLKRDLHDTGSSALESFTHEEIDALYHDLCEYD